MTKSQNTKNEQQKDLCITSEQLTEQWKKGELSNGYYWIRLSWGGMVIMAYHTAFDGLFELDDHYYDSDEISAVLASVPTFDELQNMNKAVNECMAANIKLVEQNAQLKEQINHLLKTQARQFVDNQKLQVKVEKAKDVVNIDTARQIKQLKELLKECKEVIKNVDTYYGNYDSTNGYLVINKIDEALK